MRDVSYVCTGVAVCIDLFRDKIRLLCRISVDKVVIPISVDGDTSLRDYQRSGWNVDKCAA